MLALIRGARRILEIGTLGGYNAIWLARALPAGGRLITLEADDKHARVAQATIDRAGLGARLNEMLRDEPRVPATTIQTVGAKGYDGLTIALVRPG